MFKWFLPRIFCARNGSHPRSAGDFSGFDRGPVQFFYESQGGTVEGFLSRPPKSGRFPLMVLLHGHNWARSGAQQVVPIAEKFSQELCYASLAISLPGYGLTRVAGSDADSDVVAGVVLDGITKVAQLPWVDRTKIMLYGFSRGASFAAIVTGRIPELRGVILHSGAYDLMRLYLTTSNLWLRRLMNPYGKANPALFNVLADTPNWTAPTLILHGARDEVIPALQATLLRDRLEALGKPHRFVLFPDSGHRLPPTGVKGEVLAFLEKHVGSGCLSDP